MSSRKTFGHLKECLEEKFRDACLGKGFSPKTNLGEKAYEFLKNNVEECFKYTYNRRGRNAIIKQQPALWWMEYADGRNNLSVFGYELIAAVLKVFRTGADKKHIADIKLVTPIIYKERSKTSPELQLEIEKTVQYFEKIVNLEFQCPSYVTWDKIVKLHFHSEDFANAVFEFALIQEFFNKTMKIGPNLDL